MSRRRLSRTLAVYGAALASFTFLTFYLHHLGNQLPFALAQRRLAAGLESELQELGLIHEYKDSTVFCEVALMALRGAHAGADDHPVRDALFLGTYQDGRCERLHAVVAGENLSGSVWKPHYAWGSKALFALALRFLSVREVRLGTLWGIYGSYALLALALLYLNRRTLLLGAPLIACGLGFSGIPFLSDFVGGFPYLWAIIAIAWLAVMLRHYGTGSATRLFSFAAGMMSSYLWLFDGHQTVVLAGFGLVAYFGPETGRPAHRRRTALACMAAYAGGFLAAYVLNQGVKFAFASFWINDAAAPVEQKTVEIIRHRLQHMWQDATLAFRAGDMRSLTLVREWPYFLAMGRHRFVDLNAFALTGALACAAASAYALYRAVRGPRELLSDLLWLWALGALAALQFFLPNDWRFMISRWWFVLLALAWTAPFLVAATLPRPLASLLIGSLCLIPIGTELRAQALRRAWIAGLETRVPVADEFFDVYLDLDTRTLTLWRAPCQRADVRGLFYLYFWPTAEARSRPRPPRDPLLHIFLFPRYGVRFDGQCLAAISLPPYAVSRIGVFQRALPDLRVQHALHEETQWIADFKGPGRNPLAGRNPRAQYQAVVARAPAAQAAFDVYLTDATLAYVKRPCRPADVTAKFFIHAFPTEAHALPAERQALGFDIDSFFFDEQGARVDDACLALAWWPPPYGRAGLDRIVTGQWFPGTDRLAWKTDVLLFNGQPVPDWPALFQAATTAAPAAQAAFDVYPVGRGLVVARAPCRPGDTEAPFFLHVVPQRRRDLPAARQESGFANYDFRFADRGAHFDGRCAAAVNLPAYGIRRVRIGQWRPQDGQEIWKADIPWR